MGLIHRCKAAWMVGALICIHLAGALPNVAGQTAKPTLAKVTAVGKESGAITMMVDGKKQRFVIIELEGKSRIFVASDQNVAEIHDALLAEHRRLTMNFVDKSQDLIQKQDTAGLKKAEEAFKLASDELLQHIGYCVVEGTVKQHGDELRMQGILRPYAFNGADKDLAKGKVRIEGEVQRLQENDKKNVLAIRNGDQPIVVVSKADDGKAEGTIRVFGVLSSDVKTGRPLIEAERVEK